MTDLTVVYFRNALLMRSSARHKAVLGLLSLLRRVLQQDRSPDHRVRDTAELLRVVTPPHISPHQICGHTMVPILAKTETSRPCNQMLITRSQMLKVEGATVESTKSGILKAILLHVTFKI